MGVTSASIAPAGWLPAVAGGTVSGRLSGAPVMASIGSGSPSGQTSATTPHSCSPNSFVTYVMRGVPARFGVVTVAVRTGWMLRARAMSPRNCCTER